MKFYIALTILAASASSAAAWSLSASKDSSCASPDGWSMTGEGAQSCYAFSIPPRAMNVSGLPRGLDFQTYSDANCETIQTQGGDNCYAPTGGPIFAFALKQRD